MYHGALDTAPILSLRIRHHAGATQLDRFNLGDPGPGPSDLGTGSWRRAGSKRADWPGLKLKLERRSTHVMIAADCTPATSDSEAKFAGRS